MTGGRGGVVDGGTLGLRPLGDLARLGVLASLTMVMGACGGPAGPTRTPSGASPTPRVIAVQPTRGGAASDVPTPATVTIATLTFTVDLAGPMPVSGTISRKLVLGGKPSQPCSDVTIDDIFFHGPVGGHTVLLELVPIEGSGTTGKIVLDIGSSITIDDAEEGVFAPVDAFSSLRLNGDGSGRLDVAGWGNANADTESGTISWTCGL
jgi:hypothetical protein